MSHRMSRWLVGLVLVLAAASACAGCDELERKSKWDKSPWFCHHRDCPRFKTVKEYGPFAVRRYDRTTWATVCLHDVYREEAMWRAGAELVQYIKGANKEGNKLWGGTPFVHYMVLTPEHLEAWNATAHNQSSLECMHKTVCVGYYLPGKYQDGKRPPKPKSRDVRVVRVARWTAYVAQFGGFPTKMRFIFNYIRLVNVLKWHRVPFNWRVSMGFVYDPPFVKKDRHNEVLVPAGRPCALFEDAKDLFAEDAPERVDDSWDDAADVAEEEAVAGLENFAEAFVNAQE